ncbi:thiazole biosynthesis adenylyltransferase ThiF [Bacillus suaedaesalsae]|uniref:Thiazole biosynthesis adenylyltransferase ThiF n=1 Tax=Bacillus suaedaesalsae TaxID=2810349 RepID=A0ABS2DGZ7_9BACI|nr:thiazole biosynthesis adenylyltransferase ThiF [Bacillus suaedaesalsae]MBM6617753.1 thiazole biosynthesis adenylyltransferase ThiF [Bacillus suaedaesalsae]
MSERYSRHELFAPIGVEGQQKIREKHVLIIGAGALGSGSAEALTRAGIGKLTIVDRDYVEWSNLQRQQLYGEKDVALKLPKAIAAKNRLSEINSDVEVNAIVTDATVQEFEQLVKDVHLIIDATDNFDTRLLINDISQKYNIPWIYGACVGSYGISYTIVPGETPCLHCLLEKVPVGGMTCDTAGIISPAVSMVVSYQVSEALKILVEDNGNLRKKLVTFDLWTNQYAAISVGKLKRDACTSCGVDRTYPFLSFENQLKTAVLCGRETVQIRPQDGLKRNLEELEKQLTLTGGKIERNPFLLSFEIAGKRLVIFQDGRVLIHGTKDVTEAKGIYHRYLG